MVEPRHPRLRERSPEDEAFLQELEAPKKRRPPRGAGRGFESYDQLEEAYMRLRKRNGAFNAILCVGFLIIALVAGYLGWTQAETLQEALRVLNGISFESPTTAPLPTAQIGQPAQNIQVDPAPPAPALISPDVPAQGEQGGRPNDRVQPTAEAPPPSFGGRTNDHTPAVEVQAIPAPPPSFGGRPSGEEATPPPSFGGRPNDSAAPTPAPSFGGKPKK